jgi:DNA gyrase subunit A
MGRDARGVRGINLRDGDQLVGMGVFARESTHALVVVCERGYGKRTALSEFPTKNRGGYGVIAIKTSARNGPVAGIRVVSNDDHLILISSRGKLIRMAVSGISLLGRATQGVRVMRLDEEERVASLERLADAELNQDIAEETPEEASREDLEAALEDEADDADDGDLPPEDGDEDEMDDGGDADEGDE